MSHSVNVLQKNCNLVQFCNTSVIVIVVSYVVNLRENKKLLSHDVNQKIFKNYPKSTRSFRYRASQWNCPFLGNKKSSLNQNVWRDHATMQQDVLLHFWVIFLHWNQAEIWKKIFCCPALELFHCLPLWKTVLFVSSRAFSLSTPVENSEATWKKATKCNKR